MTSSSLPWSWRGVIAFPRVGRPHCSLMRRGLIEPCEWLLPFNRACSNLMPFRIPAPRFLGFLQLPLFELLGNEKSVDLPEAFHWSCLRDDTSWELASSYDRFPVYPLFQPSVDNLNDNWIALSIGSSALAISKVSVCLCLNCLVKSLKSE